ncbi:hypothetical protein GIB67_004473 [Kingdonia uniflora]|uniref:Uncharacterized protein n=1 Tax=Kingdonia uniflora TaxID=39325 RepID=A0A7J7MRJ6_9MAGN|nr:hypothetical protein GIB67_004473 [Kingdonia uniflora]
MKSALSFLLKYEELKDPNCSDDSSSEDDMTPQKSQVVLSREAVYKLMTEDLLQDLVLYRKSHEKAVSTASRSLLILNHVRESFMALMDNLTLQKQVFRL